ncbi:hypothetical protein SAMN05878482_106165 [Peribacillus simplex]|uniref:Uncharacterized protein n=1 Tax=Peribacillus simplex TaxID=1478 RepID=A0A9X8RC32_9BACI|nr:hypothetical protein SAMN05878482_106165 [Peribacillus simplex]
MAVGLSQSILLSWLVSSLNIFKTSLSFTFFPVTLNGLKKFATLLPNDWQAETPQKGRGFLK